MKYIDFGIFYFFLRDCDCIGAFLKRGKSFIASNIAYLGRRCQRIFESTICGIPGFQICLVISDVRRAVCNRTVLVC